MNKKCQGRDLNTRLPDFSVLRRRASPAPSVILYHCPKAHHSHSVDFRHFWLISKYESGTLTKLSYLGTKMLFEEKEIKMRRFIGGAAGSSLPSVSDGIGLKRQKPCTVHGVHTGTVSASVARLLSSFSSARGSLSFLFPFPP